MCTQLFTHSTSAVSKNEVYDAAFRETTCDPWLTFEALPVNFQAPDMKDYCKAEATINSDLEIWIETAIQFEPTRWQSVLVKGLNQSISFCKNMPDLVMYHPGVFPPKGLYEEKRTQYGEWISCFGEVKTVPPERLSTSKKENNPDYPFNKDDHVQVVYDAFCFLEKYLARDFSLHFFNERHSLSVLQVSIYRRCNIFFFFISLLCSF